MDCRKYLRELLLAGIYLLGAMGIVASGGGGGSDDDDDEIIIQSLYNFIIGGPLPDDPGNNSTIGIEIPGEFSLTTEPNLVGSLICDQATEICELQTVENPSSILIDDTTDTLFTGDIDAIVENLWVYPSGSDRPSTGSLRIDQEVGSDIFVEVTNCTGGSVQVTIDLTSNCYTWDDFEDLIDAPGSTDVEVKASLAWEAIEFTVEQALNSLEVFPFIIDDVFGGGNAIFANCDIYSGNWLGPAPEPGANPGGFLFSWFDDSANGRVGTDDSFRQDFDDCWLGDSTDGALLEGIIDYVGYTQVIDQNGLLTRIGFETAASGSGKIGGVTFGDEFGNNPLVITETSEAMNGDITTENPIILTGRYLIVFE